MKKKLLFFTAGILALALAGFSSASKSTMAKATGEHECGHVCPICYGCTDLDCDDPACETKCVGAGNHLLYSEDFSSGPGDFGNHVSVSNGVAVIAGEENVTFDVNYFPLLSENSYKISFDLNMDKNNMDTFFIHFVGFNSADNVYLAIQADGYICLNVWKDGVWHYVYGFQNGLGGFGKANIEWYEKGSGNMHHFDVVLSGGFFELWVDNAKYLAQHLSQFGAYSGNPAVAGRVGLTEGTFSHLFFHAVKGNSVEFDNFEVRDLPKARNSFTLTSATNPVNYTFDTGYSVVDLQHDDFRVDLEFETVNLMATGTFAMLHLHGLNGLLGFLDNGHDCLNVQLNFDPGIGDNFAYPCIYWINDAPNATWTGNVHPPVDLTGKTSFTLSFVSLGDVIQLLIDDVVITETTYTESGIVKGHLNSIGASDNGALALYKSISYYALASAQYKADAKAELETYKNSADYREAEQGQLATIITDGKAAIDAAASIDDVDDALEEALEKIDALKTKAEYEAEEAAAALADAKTAAKAELEGYKNAEDYREAEQAQLATIISDGKAAIDAATDVDGVNAALAAAKGQIDALKTKAQYEAEESGAALENAKTAAKAELEGYKNAADYREAEQGQLATIITDGKAAIDAATDVDGVNAALAAAKGQIDALKTKAQYEAEEAAAALATKKERAISAISNYYDSLVETNQYTEANAAALLKAKNDCIAAINAATTIDEVNAAVTAGQTALDAVEKVQPTPGPADPTDPEPQPQPEPEQKSGGCGGSIIAASAIISMTALAGLGLLLSKKRRD